MKSKLALKSLPAFAAALLLGRMFLPQQRAALPAGVPFVWPPDALQKSASVAPMKAYKETLHKTYYDIDRNFKLVDSGAELRGARTAAVNAVLTPGLTITNDNNVTTTGAARFEVNKVDERTIVRNSKQ